MGFFCCCLIYFIFILAIAFVFISISVGGTCNSTSSTASCEGVVIQGAGQAAADFACIGYYLGAAMNYHADTGRHGSVGSLASLAVKYNTGLCVTALINFCLKVTLGF